MQHTHQVVGFLFTPTGSFVVLIEKTHPEWQKGKLNGIGGKMENGESYHACMVREFEEETGVLIPEWLEFCTITCNNSIRGENEIHTVHFFAAWSEDAFNAKSKTEEVVCIVPVSRLERYSTLANTRWLVPMALSMKQESATLFEISERYD